MKRRLKWLFSLCIIAALVVSFFAYTESYYRADDTALEALVSDDDVSVSKADYGWFFDGPSGKDLLVFYPGGKVEETSYAPLLHRLAEEGMDVCLL